jgi:hypothetical protein
MVVLYLQIELSPVKTKTGFGITVIFIESLLAHPLLVVPVTKMVSVATSVTDAVFTDEMVMPLFVQE